MSLNEVFKAFYRYYYEVAAEALVALEYKPGSFFQIRRPWWRGFYPGHDTYGRRLSDPDMALL